MVGAQAHQAASTRDGGTGDSSPRDGEIGETAVSRGSSSSSSDSMYAAGGRSSSSCWLSASASPVLLRVRERAASLLGLNLKTFAPHAEDLQVEEIETEITRENKGKKEHEQESDRQNDRVRERMKMRESDENKDKGER